MKDFFALSDLIKTEYLATGCDSADAAYAMHRLMSDCGVLFDSDAHAWAFLMEDE